MSYTGSKAVRGQGAQISIGTSPAVPIYEVKTVQFTGIKNNMEDVTNLNSLGRYMETQSTLIDPGQVAINGNLVNSDPGQQALVAARDAGTLQAFTVQLLKTPLQTTTGDLYAFNAYVEEWTEDYQSTKVNQFSAKLKITGPITRTLGS